MSEPQLTPEGIEVSGSVARGEFSYSAGAFPRCARAGHFWRGLHEFLRAPAPRLLGILGGGDGVVSFAAGWPSASDRQARLKLAWTQAAHWAAILVAMNIMLMPSFQQWLPQPATGMVLLILLAVGTFLAGVHLLSLQVCFLGLAMALSIPAMTWLKQASLLLLLAGVAVAGLAIAFWPRGSKRAA